MAYEKRTWVSGTTPCSSENFNHMEQGIADAHDKLNELNTKKSYILSGGPFNITVAKFGSAKRISTSGRPNSEMNANTVYNFGTLAEEYRPMIEVKKQIFLNTSAAPITAELRITPEGDVIITPYSKVTTSHWIIYTEMYI